jgi:predicted nucleic acid-binding protein
MELADTSAWTNRLKEPAVARDFGERVQAGEIATCDMVKLEILWSARDAREFNEVREDFDALPQVPIDPRVWQTALDNFQRLADRGPYHHREVGLPDLLIAAAAEVANLPVCHYDADFETIAAVTGQPVRAIAPFGSLA